MSNEPMATDRQRSYIVTLGGRPRKGLTKADASKVIDRLRKKAPANEGQIRQLKLLKANIPSRITVDSASRLIEYLKEREPPSQQQLRYLRVLGGKAPSSKIKASELISRLEKTVPATAMQRKEAQTYGRALPPGTTVAAAEKVLQVLELDADPKEGGPLLKRQKDRIIKLGGDPRIPKNRWRADDYIEKLENKAEDFHDRVEDCILGMFSDEISRSMVSVRKPSKKVVGQALKWGDQQGWKNGWEDCCSDAGPSDPFTRVSLAVYKVAPQLLKKGVSPPRLSVQKGCLSVFVLGMLFPLLFGLLSA